MGGEVWEEREDVIREERGEVWEEREDVIREERGDRFGRRGGRG